MIQDAAAKVREGHVQSVEAPLAITSEQLAAFTELLMVSDPWPLSERSHSVLTELADDASRENGFCDWIEAYHKLESIK